MIYTQAFSQNQEEEVGARIRDLREAKRMSQSELAARLCLVPDAIRKLERGTSGAKQFIKLTEIAQILGTTPNQILGVQESLEREAIRGVLEAIFLEFGKSLDDAKRLAECALSAMDSPAVRESSGPIADNARSQGLRLMGPCLRGQT